MLRKNEIVFEEGQNVYVVTIMPGAGNPIGPRGFFGYGEVYRGVIDKVYDKGFYRIRRDNEYLGVGGTQKGKSSFGFESGRNLELFYCRPRLEDIE
jgi:hypothetical protein